MSKLQKLSALNQEIKLYGSNTPFWDRRGTNFVVYRDTVWHERVAAKWIIKKVKTLSPLQNRVIDVMVYSGYLCN